MNDVPRNDKGRCALCGGPGYKPDGDFCECPIGRDLADMDRWNKAKTETSTELLPTSKLLNGGVPRPGKRASVNEALRSILSGYGE